VDRPEVASPFADLAPAVVAVGAYLVAAAGWLVLGGGLPSGRWLAVHLFTLGALTNAVVAFSQHFARTVTRRPERPPRGLLVTLNLGVAAVLAGTIAGASVLTAAGGAATVAVVVVAAVHLDRLCRRALGARFTWIVRVYVQAHAAFVVGALLGVALGTGVAPAAWHAGLRAAHLHAMVLGWGGLTLLATGVFFGPTIVRARIRPGAEGRARAAIGQGAVGLTVAVAALAMSGPGGVAARVVAAGGLVGFAAAVTQVCLPMARSALAAGPSAARWPVAAVATWFPLVVWADAVAVAVGSGTWATDALGVVVLLGVLVQIVVATVGYVGPQLRARDGGGRARVTARLARGAGLRAALFNLGVLVLALAIAVPSAAGWPGGLVHVAAAPVVWVVVRTVAAVAWPDRGPATAA
jgi:hypothetical protein